MTKNNYYPQMPPQILQQMAQAFALTIQQQNKNPQWNTAPYAQYFDTTGVMEEIEEDTDEDF